MKKQTIMKSLLATFVGLTLFLGFYSCSSDVEKQDVKVSQKELTYDDLSGNQIGFKTNNGVKLNVPAADLVHMFKLYAIENKLNITPEKVAVINQDNQDFLRFYNTDKTVSTVALLTDTDGKLVLGKTICTSVQCASGGGCIPDGNYCTKCVPSGVNPNSGITGDCTRSTSN